MQWKTKNSTLSHTHMRRRWNFSFSIRYLLFEYKQLWRVYTVHCTRLCVCVYMYGTLVRVCVYIYIAFIVYYVLNERNVQWFCDDEWYSVASIVSKKDPEDFRAEIGIFGLTMNSRWIFIGFDAFPPKPHLFNGITSAIFSTHRRTHTLTRRCDFWRTLH